MTADQLERIAALAAKLTESLTDAAICANELLVLSKSSFADHASPELGKRPRETLYEPSRPYVDVSRFSVHWGGKVCPLRHTLLFRMAHCLVRQRNQFVSNDQLLRDVWHDGVKAPETVPLSFTTRSNVILVANEWHSANANIRALEDRAIILHFDPSNAEILRRVGEWFDDQLVYEFMANVLHFVPFLSMRYYCKGSQLRRAVFSDWRTSLLQMALPDPRVACIASLQHDPSLRTERARVERFILVTGYSRASYFRMKAELARRARLQIPIRP